MTPARLLEVCCADPDSVTAAISGGADRIELCSALGEGGLTPSIALIKHAVRLSETPVNVLIRVRGGDFLYSATEADIMERDIQSAADAGASGVVVGALTLDGDIDMAICHRLTDTAKAHGLTVTFHRAFDLCRDPYKSFDDILSLGCDRLLTSGHAPSALAGADMIAKLRLLGDGKVIILAGAGVTPENAAEIIRLTGVTELHASAKTTVNSHMRFRLDGVAMGNPGADEYSRTTTSEQTVRQLAEIIHKQ